MKVKTNVKIKTNYKRGLVVKTKNIRYVFPEGYSRKWIFEHQIFGESIDFTIPSYHLKTFPESYIEALWKYLKSNKNTILDCNWKTTLLLNNDNKTVFQIFLSLWIRAKKNKS